MIISEEKLYIPVDVGLLGSNAARTRKYATFWTNIYGPEDGIMVFTYKSAQHYYPEDQHQDIHHHENLKSHTCFMFAFLFVITALVIT